MSISGLFIALFSTLFIGLNFGMPAAPSGPAASTPTQVPTVTQADASRVAPVVTPAVAEAVAEAVEPAAAPQANCPFRVVGHRGTEAGVAHNNTVAAFRRAVAGGADVVEMDVHRTAPDRDGRRTWVVHHDPIVGSRSISDTTLSALRALHPDLATFDEAARVVARAGVDIEVEIKPDQVSSAALREALGILTTHGLRHTAVLTSAHPPVLARLESLAGPTDLGLIIRESTDPEWLAARADRVLIRHNLVSADFVAAAHARGLLVEVWTVDTADGWRAASRYGVDGVITDRTADLIAWCADHDDASASPTDGR